TVIIIKCVSSTTISRTTETGKEDGHVSSSDSDDINDKSHGELQNADCQLEHQPLDPRCDVIRRYRTDLNKAVKMAIQERKLHRQEMP
ncbi:unnamed protein product, partial [Didymodactylos carnosus]